MKKYFLQLNQTISITIGKKLFRFTMQLDTKIICPIHEALILQLMYKMCSDFNSYIKRCLAISKII